MAGREMAGGSLGKPRQLLSKVERGHYTKNFQDSRPFQVDRSQGRGRWRDRSCADEFISGQFSSQSSVGKGIPILHPDIPSGRFIKPAADFGGKSNSETGFYDNEMRNYHSGPSRSSPSTRWPSTDGHSFPDSQQKYFRNVDSDNFRTSRSYSQREFERPCTSDCGFESPVPLDREFGRPSSLERDYGRSGPSEREFGRPASLEQEFGQSGSLEQDFGRSGPPDRDFGRPVSLERNFESLDPSFQRQAPLERDFGRTDSLEQVFDRPGVPERDFGRPGPTDRKQTHEHGRAGQLEHDFGRSGPTEQKFGTTDASDHELGTLTSLEHQRELERPDPLNCEFGGTPAADDSVEKTLSLLCQILVKQNIPAESRDIPSEALGPSTDIHSEAQSTKQRAAKQQKRGPAENSDVFSTFGKQIIKWADFRGLSNDGDCLKDFNNLFQQETETCAKMLAAFKCSLKSSDRDVCYYSCKPLRHPALMTPKLDDDLLSLLMEKGGLDKKSSLFQLINPVEKYLFRIQEKLLKCVTPLLMVCNSYELALKVQNLSSTQQIASTLEKTIMNCRRSMVLIGQTFSLATQFRHENLLEVSGLQGMAPKPFKFPNFEDSALFGKEYMENLKTWLQKSGFPVRLKKPGATAMERKKNVLKTAKLKPKIQVPPPADPKVKQMIDELVECVVEDATQLEEIAFKKDNPACWFLFDQSSHEYKYYKAKLTEMQRLKRTTRNIGIQTRKRGRTPEELATESVRAMRYARKVSKLKKTLFKSQQIAKKRPKQLEEFMKVIRNKKKVRKATIATQTLLSACAAQKRKTQTSQDICHEKRSTQKHLLVSEQSPSPECSSPSSSRKWQPVQKLSSAQSSRPEQRSRSTSRRRWPTRTASPAHSMSSASCSPSPERSSQNASRKRRSTQKTSPVRSLSAHHSPDPVQQQSSHSESPVQSPSPQGATLSPTCSQDFEDDRQTMETAVKLAKFVAKFGPEVEKLTIENSKDNPEFWFLYDKASAAHKFYKMKVAQFSESMPHSSASSGESTRSSGGSPAPEAEENNSEEEPEEPEPAQEDFEPKEYEAELYTQEEAVVQVQEDPLIYTDNSLPLECSFEYMAREPPSTLKKKQTTVGHSSSQPQASGKTQESKPSQQPLKSNPTPPVPCRFPRKRISSKSLKVGLLPPKRVCLVDEPVVHDPVRINYERPLGRPAPKKQKPQQLDFLKNKLTEGNLGYKMLKKMGWKEGLGLGSGLQGIKEPVKVWSATNI
nr:PREDICTED: SURP and G-patch domain-containing protein 2 isoform X2 [Latimeria chalumnae]|eukprot:XP_014348719.1 PREDICTED: SURP and G-patch domain-containing protein 2 isoform X2 [Latimeria chalumnae]